MANFKQAIKWLKEGKKVRRSSWHKEHYIYSNPQVNRIMWNWQTEDFHICATEVFGYNDDWEIYEEPKKIKAFIVDTFKHKGTGEIIHEIMGEEYDDGTSTHHVFDGSKFELVKSRRLIEA